MLTMWRRTQRGVDLNHWLGGVPAECEMLRNAMAVFDLYTLERPELGVAEAADLLGRHRSTVSRWLSAMAQAGFLERESGSGRYRVSMRMAALAEVARRATPLQREARLILDHLAKSTGETANLAVLDGQEVVNVDVAQSPQPIMHVGWLGRRLPLHATSSGKVFLTWPGPGIRADPGPAPFRRFTAVTITDSSALIAELDRVRSQGYATTWAELAPDLVTTAAPVRDHLGAVIAAIAVSAPISRVTRERLTTLAHTVVQAAEELSARMGYR